MLAKLLAATLLATAVFAQDDCDPITTAPPVDPTPPVTNGAAIHPNGNSAKCVDVQSANFSNGTPVTVYDCNNTNAQKFAVGRGNGQVKVQGQNLCLDAGENPANGSKVKVWQCYPGLKQQQWWYTDDDRIALTNQGLCLDLTDGSLQNGSQLQVWECATGNTNQVWTTGNLAARRFRRRRI